MKYLYMILMVITIFVIAACKKNETTSTTIPPATQQDNYSSIQDFYAKNGVAMQTYTVDAASGGNFTTPQGTKVIVKGGVFYTSSHVHVDTGKIKIEFKDIYNKSDMLMSDKPTIDVSGLPLKSGGEFFIRASQNGKILQALGIPSIQVKQPVGVFGADIDMMAFTGQADSSGFGWKSTPDTLNGGVVAMTASDYVFSFYAMQATSVDSGTWGNSDSPSYFSSFSQTVLTLHATDDPKAFSTDVFLVFKNINCMIHVYRSVNDFAYEYAPQGLECTVVAVGIKGGKLYSSFKPITIGSNQTVSFTLSLTTTDDFKTQMQALN